MPLDDFWYDDEELFECYIEAYNSKLSRAAWLNNVYTLRAVESAINNIMPVAISYALSGGKFSAIQYYTEPIDLLHPVQQQDIKEIEKTVDPDTLYQLQLKSFNL